MKIKLELADCSLYLDYYYLRGLKFKTTWLKFLWDFNFNIKMSDLLLHSNIHQDGINTIMSNIGKYLTIEQQRQIIDNIQPLLINYKMPDAITKRIHHSTKSFYYYACINNTDKQRDEFTVVLKMIGTLNQYENYKDLYPVVVKVLDKEKCNFKYMHDHRYLFK